MSILKKSIELVDTIKADKYLSSITDALSRFKHADCYIGGGCVAQTVWNLTTDKPIGYGINDIDIAFFDSNDVGGKLEEQIYSYLKEELGDFPFWLDIKNQANVHLWYREKFGYDIQPYTSIESAINTWPTTSSALAIRKIDDNNWQVYAPFGLDDLFNLNVVANNRQITEAIYLTKSKRWKDKWSRLKINAWNEEKNFLDNRHMIDVKL